jgi:two-component system chemotaxis family response regulator WspR
MTTDPSAEIPSDTTVIATDPRRSDAAPAPDAGENAVVLLVDDQPIVAEALRQMFVREPDIAFHYCSDPLLALSIAAQVGATVILQDLVMPGMDGLALVRAFRANPATGRVPIIVLSSKEDPRDKCAAFTAGASDYLVKIPDPIELIARVNSHSRSHRAQLERDEAYRSLARVKRELEESNAALARLSTIDSLTDLPNRRRFDDALDAEWRRAARSGTPVSLILIDVDFFKRFNDHYGHPAGDECLRQVAAALRARTLRGTSMIARYGGEEFVALLPDQTSAGARVVAEALRAGVEGLRLPHIRSEVSSYVTISLGIATALPAPNTSSADLVARADTALYEAKQSGRNRLAVHPESS